MKHQYSVNTPISSAKCRGNRGYRRLLHNRKEQKKRSVYLIGKSGVFALYGIDEIQELALLYVCTGEAENRENREFYHKPLRKKSMLRRAKHGKPCPNIPDFSSSFQRHTGFPSGEGMLYGAKGLEFPKNSPWGWVGQTQAHSRVLCPFWQNP